MGLYYKMMKNCIFILIFLVTCSCTARSVKLKYYLSTLENIKELPPSEEESVIIDSLNQKSKEFYEKCKQENLNLFGMSNFKQYRIQRRSN